MTDVKTLLARHLPRLYFDAQEVYFADSAAEWTDNPGNVLRRGVGQGAARIAVAGGQPALSLAFLARDIYGDGHTRVQREDTLSDPSREYQAQAAALHLDERYANRIYGHAVEGSDKRLWLQYWFFYFYDDFAVAGFGVHEGDWEMIQLRLGSDEQPDLAVYAQHRHAEQRPWRNVKRAADDNQQPVVYVARGSHACYFDSGAHWTGVWFDQADGKRRSKRPATLEIVGDASPGWIGWPGWWGDTRKLSADDPFDQDSPRGPSQHVQWRDPVALIQAAVAHVARPPAAPPPSPPLPQALEVRRDAGRLDVDYRFAAPRADQAAPAKLVVTINSRDDRLTPASFAYPVSQPAGTVTAQREVPDDQRCDIHVSTVSADGVATAAIAIELNAAQKSAAWPTTTDTPA
jgi:hypothetical protein